MEHGAPAECATPGSLFFDRALKGRQKTRRILNGSFPWSLFLSPLRGSNLFQRSRGSALRWRSVLHPWLPCGRTCGAADIGPQSKPRSGRLADRCSQLSLGYFASPLITCIVYACRDFADLFSRLLCGSSPWSTISVPCLTSSGVSFSSGQGVSSKTSKRMPPSGARTQRDFRPGSCPPGMVHMQPFSTVASSSANHKPATDIGSV